MFVWFRVSVQYVIEEWDFRDLTLKMRPPVFIPRPETEVSDWGIFLCTTTVSPHVHDKHQRSSASALPLVPYGTSGGVTPTVDTNLGTPTLKRGPLLRVKVAICKKGTVLKHTRCGFPTWQPA